MRIVSDRI